MGFWELGLGVSSQIKTKVHVIMASLVAQTVKNLPAMQETQVQSLGQEDTLEKAMASHSSILAWEIPLTEGSDGLQSEGLQKCWTQLCD